MAGWPTWAPDGRRLACFVGTEGAPDSAALRVCDVDGPLDLESAPFGDGLPIHASWSDDGRWLATLAHHPDGLALALWDPARLDRCTELERATPLFTCWAGGTLTAFAGGLHLPTSRLLVFNPETRARRTLPGRPGNFCTPVWRAPHLFYAVRQEGEPTLLRVHLDSGTTRALETFQGLSAFTLSPDGRWLARATAPGGDGTPYLDLGLVDPEDGATRPLRRGPCLAWLWSPDGARLVVASVDTDDNSVQWSVVEVATGSERALIRLRPTRELAFYLRFFEQFALTHPLFEPNGQASLRAGAPTDAPGSPTPHLWRVPLEGAAPSPVVEGVFGVFPPARGG